MKRQETDESMKVDDKRIPKEAEQVLVLIKELLENQLVAVYLYGSAVMGGLRANSDVDIFAVTDSGLSETTSRKLTEGLLQISGKPGNLDSVRPLEVTVINQYDVVPWQFPPKYEFMYGEWLREQFERGDFPKPTIDPDLALLLAQLEQNSINLCGPDAKQVLAPIPQVDVQRAIKESLPGLLASLNGDERNVILTLARMWFTASTYEFTSKDLAAEWAIPQLPEPHASLLDQARKAYVGEVIDNWEGMETEVSSLVDHLRQYIAPLQNY